MVKEKIREFALDPTNAKINFDLGLSYYLEGHYGSAINFFHRTSELTDNDNLIYQSLILCANALHRQGNREHSSTGFILHALSINTKRPEAWFLYLRHHEEKHNWQECYTISKIALEICNFNSKNFDYSEYPGVWAIKFILAKSAFNIGRSDECRMILQKIVDNHWDQMSVDYRKWIEDEIIRRGDGPGVNHIKRYYQSNLGNFKFPFNGIESISKNYSQTYQDMFILSVLNGKKNGNYLEIGSDDPYHNSNTYLLELFGWKGISIEIKEDQVEKFNRFRSNKSICEDATKIDYKKLLDENFQVKNLDYLQLDCEPSKTTFEILLSIPFESYKFAVITYEHDHSMDMTRTYREKSRRYLESHGYVLLVNDIGPNEWFSYEDWWVHPDLVDIDVIDKMKSQKSINKVEEYFLNC